MAAGQQVYAAQCQSCHDQSGLGLPGVGPPLVASPSVAGSPGVVVRVLLNGKEGPIGLMPSLGASMSDGDVAAVLTYIRRAWGNTAGAVDADTVSRIRAAVADRTRPWTSEELATVSTAVP